MRKKKKESALLCRCSSVAPPEKHYRAIWPVILTTRKDDHRAVSAPLSLKDGERLARIARPANPHKEYYVKMSEDSYHKSLVKVPVPETSTTPIQRYRQINKYISWSVQSIGEEKIK